MVFNKIALIGAMDEEIELLVGQMEHMRLAVKAGIAFREGAFLGKTSRCL